MFTWLEQFLRDVRFGLRNLAKSPGFTAIAVLSLALGIMATTAIYSVIHAVVLDPFPYKDVDKLMSVRVWDKVGSMGMVMCSPLPPEVLRNVGRPKSSSLRRRIRVPSITCFQATSGPGSRSNTS